MKPCPHGCPGKIAQADKFCPECGRPVQGDFSDIDTMLKMKYPLGGGGYEYLNQQSNCKDDPLGKI